MIAFQRLSKLSNCAFGVSRLKAFICSPVIFVLLYLGARRIYVIRCARAYERVDKDWHHVKVLYTRCNPFQYARPLPTHPSYTLVARFLLPCMCPGIPAIDTPIWICHTCWQFVYTHTHTRARTVGKQEKLPVEIEIKKKKVQSSKDLISLIVCFLMSMISIISIIWDVIIYTSESKVKRNVNLNILFGIVVAREKYRDIGNSCEW